jgi:small GTP-binding protein
MFKSYKVCLIGGENTGKTTFVSRRRGNEFKEDYQPTMGVDVQTITLETNLGTYVLRIWDTAGQKRFEGLGAGYYASADAALAFYSESTMDATTQMVEKFQRVCPNAPIIDIWSKADLSLPLMKDHGRLKYAVSAKINWCMEDPLLAILECLRPKICLIKEHNKIIIKSELI